MVHWKQTVETISRHSILPTSCLLMPFINLCSEFYVVNVKDLRLEEDKDKNLKLLADRFSRTRTFLKDCQQDLMLDGGNWIYGLHVIIHSRLFAECKVWQFSRTLWSKDKDFVVQGQGLVVWGQGLGLWLVNWSMRTRTFVENNNTCCQFDLSENYQYLVFVWRLLLRLQYLLLTYRLALTDLLCAELSSGSRWHVQKAKLSNTSALYSGACLAEWGGDVTTPPKISRPPKIYVKGKKWTNTKARFPLPGLTARVDGWPVSITCQLG